MHVLLCRFRKARRVWFGGAREKREAHDTLGRIVRKSETTKNRPAFQDLNGTKGVRNSPIISTP